MRRTSKNLDMDIVHHRVPECSACASQSRNTRRNHDNGAERKSAYKSTTNRRPRNATSMSM